MINIAQLGRSAILTSHCFTSNLQSTYTSAMSFKTTTTLICAIGAGITAAADTRLASAILRSRWSQKLTKDSIFLRPDDSMEDSWSCTSNITNDSETNVNKQKEEVRNSLSTKLHEKISEANSLLKQCQSFSGPPPEGLDKLQRKIETELAFFTQLDKNPKKLKESHITCSNLPHFSGIVAAATKFPDCVAVLKSFRLDQQDSSSNKLVVDVVASGGSEWVKIVARNPRGLLRAWVAGDSKRERNLVDQAGDYLKTAASHPHLYKAPRIIFDFQLGVPDRLGSNLEKIGVGIRGDIVPSTQLPNWVCVDDEDSSDEDSGDKEEEEEGWSEGEEYEDESPSTSGGGGEVEVGEGELGGNVPINLDVTAFFAFVSALTNGGAEYKFTENLLDEQAGWERQRPVLPLLHKLTQGRKLMCCETAYTAFQEIVGVVGGVGEKRRADKFLSDVSVYPDVLSERAAKLAVGGKIKSRSKIIFGSGDYYQAITLTANHGFVHAASHQGVDFAVLLHESRALSEQKQAHATPISN